MKTYRIVIFIFLIISVLALICWLFPKDGLRLSDSFTLRFPTIEQILTRNHAADIADIEIPDVPARDTVLDSKTDSVNFYKELAVNQLGHFYFPDDDLHFFDDFFVKLRRARADSTVVRILHYGDSQIELDRLSGNLRQFFQKTFGGGGPGCVPAVLTIPTPAVSTSFSGDYSAYIPYGDGNRTSTGNYGMLAKNVQVAGQTIFFATAANSKKTTDNLKQFSHITLLFANRGAHFSATLSDRRQKISLPQETDARGVQKMTWRLDTALTSIRLHLSGTADLYGVCLDNGFGVSVDNVPMRGCSGTIFTNINDSILRQNYALANVGLIIMQFGGNSVPGLSSEKSIEGYKNRIAAQIRHLQRACPTAKILFIGPADMSKRVNGQLRTYPVLPTTIAALKAAALENGAAFWDMYEVMGGENSMLAWVQNGLAGNDYIHFTPAGADKMGNILVNSFETIYRLYLSQKELDAVKQEREKMQETE